MVALIVTTLAQPLGRESAPVWVFFADKGLAADEMALALQKADQALSPRARARRGRNAFPSRLLADYDDLPLCDEYLRQAAATGAVLRHSIPWLNAASFEASPAAIADLNRLPCVARVEPVRRMARAAIPTPQPVAHPGAAPTASKSGTTPFDYGYSLAAMTQANVLPLHALGYTGQGILVGMLDTGFKVTHESLVHIPVLAQWDFINDDDNVDYQGDDLAAQRDHGTETLSTLAGYFPGAVVGPAPMVSVVLAKTELLVEELPVEEDYWVAGLAWAESLGVDIVSSSLGYLDWYDFSDEDGNTAISTIAADLAADRGVVIVNSAGNFGGSDPSLLVPADGNRVIAVGAVNSQNVQLKWSSTGPTADGRIKPDVMALGSGNIAADPEDNHGYLSVAGTSFSCPLVAGVVALMLEHSPDLTVDQVITALRATANSADDPNNFIGWGVIDAFAAATWFGPTFRHTPLAQLTDETAPVTIAADISCRQGLEPGSVKVVWRLNGGAWTDLPMQATSGDTSWAATLPAREFSDTVDYYLEARGNDGIVQTDPLFAPQEFHSSHVTMWNTSDFAVQPHQGIPDASGVGATAVFPVGYAGAGLVQDVRVDVAISHPAPDQLVVKLTSPRGTVVTLSNRDGVGPDLIGSWPGTLTVSGPGSLQDFRGEHNVGQWKLNVSDLQVTETGILDSAAIHFVVYDYVTVVPPTTSPGNGFALSAAPNPFNPGTTIRIRIPAGTAPLALDIVDLSGRRIKRLRRDLRSAGPAAYWDGRDGAGRTVASGTYFAVLRGPEVVATSKLLLLK